MTTEEFMHERVRRFFDSLSETEKFELDVAVQARLRGERKSPPTRWESTQQILEYTGSGRFDDRELASYHMLEERDSDALRICRDVLFQ